MSAQFTGAAPRYLGSKEAWRLIQPYRGSASTAGGSRLPYATTTITSGCNAASASTTAAGRRRAGCTMVRWCSRASALTAEAAVCCPLPRGRSGCVTTAMIWCGEASNVRSVGHAKGAVPMKMMRIASLQTQPLAPLPLGALKLADHEITRRWAHAIEKQHPLQVVHFVLEGACEQPFSLDLHDFAMTVHTTQDYLRGSWCRAVYPRQAQAPFVFLDPS